MRNWVLGTWEFSVQPLEFFAKYKTVPLKFCILKKNNKYKINRGHIMWPNGPFWSLQDASCSLLIGKALRIAVSQVMMNVRKLYILSWLVTHIVSTRELSVHVREGCCQMMCSRKIHDLDPTSTGLSMILTTLVLSSKSKWSWVVFVKCCYKIDLKTLDKCLIQDKV